jgi:membrane associated rhomboid family serine protease
MGCPVELVRLVAFFALITLSLQFWPGASAALRFSRISFEQGAFWQLLTSQWVHLSHWHAAGNVFAFALIVLASGFWIRWPFQLLALCGGYAGVAVVVAFDPNCSYYAGASGALHGLLAGNAMDMAWVGHSLQQSAAKVERSADVLATRWTRLVATAVLSILALKLFLQAGSTQEAPWGGWGFPVYHPAHVAGALGGLGLVLLVLAARALLATKVQPKGRQ